MPRCIRVGLGGAAALVVGLSIGACGGGGADTTEVATSTVTETTTAAAEESAEAAPRRKPKSKPPPPTPAEAAEQVVGAYYAAVDERRFGAAWDLLAPALQAELGGYDAWKDGYDSTVATKTTSINATAVSADAATVALELKATDSDACGDLVDQTFAGTWTLARTAKRDFLGSAFAVDKTGGGTPVTDASSCSGGGGGGVPLVPVGCDPNYTGCVPPYPPDVDCIDVREEVEVIGEDVHNLDLESDGKACEPYFD